MPCPLRPLALASLLAACGAPETQNDDSSTSVATTGTTQVDATITTTGELPTTTTTPTSTDTTSSTSSTSTTGDTGSTSSTGHTTNTTDTSNTGDTDDDTSDTGDSEAPVDPSWLRSFGTPDDQHPGGVGLAPDGGVWVAGDFTGSIDLGLGPLTGDGTGLYLARTTATGETTHAQALFPADGQPTFTQISGLGIDSQGGLAITGWLEGTYTLGGQAMTADEIDVYIARYDAAGQPLWGQRFGEVDWQVGHAVDVGADDSVWVSGAALAPFMVGDLELTGTASTGMFVIRLDADGAPIFAKWWGDDGDQEARGIAVCNDGSAAIVGFFTDTLTFGAETIEPLAGKDMFIARIDPQGQPLWIRAFVGTGTDYGTHVDCDEDVTFAAVVTGTATIGDLEITAGGAADIVLGRFDMAGTLTWAAAITGADDQLPAGVATLPDGATAVLLTTSATTTLGATDYPALGPSDLLFAAYPAGATTPSQLLGLGGRDPQRAGSLGVRGSVATFAATLSGTVTGSDLPAVTTLGPQDLGLARFTASP